MDTDMKMKQQDEIGERNTFESNVSANAQENTYEGHEVAKNGDGRKGMVIENEWLTPKRA